MDCQGNGLGVYDFITKEQYDYGMQLAKDIIENKKPIQYHPELFDLEHFDNTKNKNT